jgi:cell fate regulator YaaT (PSP1 superfamily)
MNNIDDNKGTDLYPDINKDKNSNIDKKDVQASEERKIIEKPLNLKLIDDFKIKYPNANLPSKIFINQEYYKKFSVSKAQTDFKIVGEVSELVEVTFKNKRRQLFLNKNKLPFLVYQYVIVENDGGLDIGTITSFGKSAEIKQKLFYKDIQPSHSVLRHANLEDIEKHKKNIENTKFVIENTRNYIEKLELNMKVTDAEWQLDKQRLTIFFTAPQRIDFRQLIKELAREFKTRIELRQISSREEAKRIGGMGPCGRVLCCASFAHDHCHVTLEHARTQQLSNNIAKLSGYCGRLKCCLLYEYATYIETFKKYPCINAEIVFPEGKAKILKADIFREIIYTYLLETGSYKTISFKEFVELSENGKVIQLKPENGKTKEFEKLMLIDEDDIEDLKKLED